MIELIRLFGFYDKKDRINALIQVEDNSETKVKNILLLIDELNKLDYITINSSNNSSPYILNPSYSTAPE